MVSPMRIGRLPLWLWTVMIASAFIARSPGLLNAHPLHTTISELTFDPASKAMRLSIRVFNEDLAAAIAKRSGASIQPKGAVADSAALSYVRKTISLVDQSGRALILTSCGSRPLNDLLVLCITTTATTGPSTLRLRQGMLVELYDDQVNVVQTRYGGRRRSLLFTRSSAAQGLP